MRINIKEVFKNYLPDSEIYIIAGGASMDYIDPSFFDNKITIGVNESFRKYKNCNFYLRKDGRVYQGFDIFDHIKTVSPKSKLIVSDYYGGAIEWPKNEWPEETMDYYYFEHVASHGEMDFSVLEKDEDKLVMGIGICAIAIHFAAYMGAKNIILCGNDTGFIDNKDYFAEYGTYECPTSHTGTLSWTKDQTETVAQHFRNKGLNIVSINPFVNFQLEGHYFTTNK